MAFKEYISKTSYRTVEVIADLVNFGEKTLHKGDELIVVGKQLSPPFPNNVDANGNLIWYLPVAFPGAQNQGTIKMEYVKFTEKTEKNVTIDGKETSRRAGAPPKGKSKVCAELGEIAPGLGILIVLGLIFGGGGTIWIIFLKK